MTQLYFRLYLYDILRTQQQNLASDFVVVVLLVENTPLSLVQTGKYICSEDNRALPASPITVGKKHSISILGLCHCAVHEERGNGKQSFM